MGPRKKTYILGVSTIFLTIVFRNVFAAETTISCITPKHGSLNGQTRLTIDGKNFARSQFNFGVGNEHLGSKVNLVSATRSIPCEIHPDGTHETQIMCYTEKMPEDDYYVRVSIDGKDVPIENHCSQNINCCKFRPQEKYTPTIEEVTPRSGRPGTKIKITGKLVTDRYGSNLARSSNGLTEKLLRVYMGSQNCELKDLAADEFFGLSLDNNGNSWNGQLLCQEKGTFIGHLNGSFIVEGGFGRSRVNPKVLRVSSTDVVHMFQTFTGISSISSNAGSKLGGLMLTIYGKHFDETTAPVKIMVGDTPCPVVGQVQDEVIVCRVAAEPTVTPAAYSGARGLIHHIWNETTKTASDLDDVSTLSTSASDYSFMNIDEMYFSHDDRTNYVSKMEGFFVPPRNGDYEFFIMADNHAKLYLSTDENPSNKVQIAESTMDKTYFDEPGQKSAMKSLLKGKNYYIEAIHRQGSSKSNTKVAARVLKTEFTEMVTGMARQERQNINIKSTVVNEELTITVTPASSVKTAVSEVQTVTVNGPTDSTFRLGMYSAYTSLLKVSSSSDEIKKAIEALPGVQPDIVTVTSTPSATGTVIVVTFQSKKGDLPDMIYEISTDFASSTTISVAETTKGLPGLEGYQFIMAGIPSPMILPDASANDLKNALLDMFSVQCPPALGNPSGTTYFENYESTVPGNFGKSVAYPEPFCGRRSTVNPHFIFYKGGSDETTLGKSITQYKTLCLAYKGKLNRIALRYSFADGANVVRRAILSWAVTVENPTEWEFSCWDMLEKVKAHKSDGTAYRADWITVTRSVIEEDLYIDSVAIARAPLSPDPNAAKQRMRPAKPNGFMIEDVEVTSSTPSSYTVTLFPFDCGFAFPLMAVAHSKLSSGATNPSSNSATFTYSNSGSNIGVSITRNKRASVPITGTFTVSFNNETSNAIPAFSTSQQVELELEAVSTFGNIEVVRTGTCANMKYAIKWITRAGDQPPIELNAGDLAGNVVQSYVENVQDGCLWYDPISGDMTRIKEPTPQVSLYINNLPSACDGDCSFQWMTSATPTIISVNPTQGTEAQSTSITISGTGFDTTASNNTITIGGVPCNATTATSTSLTCDVGNGPTGQHNIIVNVLGKGLASGTVQFEYVSAITSVNPPTGSIAGGRTLTIVGYGFMQNSTVTVGGNTCVISSIAPGTIVCITPPAQSVSGGAVDVVVTQSAGSPLISPTQFTYDASSSSTPVITAISATTSKIEGGESITIDGTGFGSSASSDDALKIGGNVASISNYSDTQIVAVLPSNPQGSYPVMLSVANKGYADLRTNSIADIVYTLQVTNIFPSKGSLFGGARVTITGSGFTTNATLLDIKFGRNKCEVESSTPTKIICLIEDTAVVRLVKNTGTHIDYGYGYEWNPKHAEVKVGDKVKWQWTTPTWITNIGYGIYQTVNASTTVSADAGFTTGSTKLAQGAFEHRFTTPGTYYYWSGFVDEHDIISLKGTVKVVDRASTAEQLSLKISGHEANYQTGGSNPATSGPCTGTTAAISGCSDPEPSGSDNTKFHFKFWKCLSPTVTSMDLTNGTTADSITLQGTGFGTNNCENEVTVGDGTGIVSLATGTSVSFTIDPSTSPTIGSLSKPSIRINNRGFALIDIANTTFALMPLVSSITPTSGSTAGGTKITLEGSGFQGSKSDITVNVDVYPCSIETMNYTQIVCITPALPEGTVNVSLIVSVGGQQYPAECSSCLYNYNSADSPTATIIFPTTVTGSSTSLTITGTLFGTSSQDVRVVISGEECSIVDVNATNIRCDIGGVATGTHPVAVYITGKGKAVSTITVNSPATISSITPSQGSVNGGTVLTIDGNGFVPSYTNVSIDGSDCDVLHVTFTQIQCRSPAHAAGSTSLVVTAGAVAYSGESFTYATSASPAVSNVNPTQGLSSGTLTITGTGFSSNSSHNSVTINGVPCVVSASTTTSITCTVGSAPSGTYPVIVHVVGSGNSDSSTTFTYQMTLTGISPTSGSSSGGQSVTLAGTGFLADSMSVTICGQPCALKSSAIQTSTSYVCVTPAAASTVVSTQQCDVIATLNSLTKQLANGYTYDASITPEVTGVSPGRGGTAGGTSITITGSGFGTTPSDVSVTIDESTCTVSTVTATQIVCETGAGRPSDTKVRVEIQGNGIAKQTNAGFYYIDVWSSRYTWGNADPPTDGDLVVIPKNQTLLLDTDTAVLKMLVIQGGKLIFDEKDVELKTENILITDGGLLQVGTEDQPFQHKGIITLYGNLRSRELPIYGTKCLAVREGTLDLHGKPTHITWSRLASTAAAGATSITLQQPVEWQVGDEIVIATTGHRHTQNENEVRKIASISGDKQTLTLTEALTYTHLGISETFNGVSVDFRAEVGLLTHNVVVRGSRNVQWDTKIEKCPAGFDTGEFATQTCFQGRFGEEMGSDQFGGQIMLHAPRKDENLAVGRISYVEVTHAGQAFRLGRYPIHFHLNGDMSKSYVRGCGIHNTFNRAVNVHFTHNTLVEHNVIYNIMGGAFFLEDGIETGNTFQYNLGVFVRASTSLLNDDITPATFWVTNPNNTIRHNAAVGGSHFGFWYRMHLHPEGPSKTDTVCPKHVPLGEFNNNTAHSFGWFGLWIFEDYFPKVDGSCSSTAAHATAVFKALTAWNCEKGAETVNTGAIQFEDFVMVNNEKAGIELKQLSKVPQFTDDGALTRNGLIVGHSSNLDTEVPNGCTHGGMVLPYQSGYMVKGTKFVNFDKPSCAAFRFTRITGTCSFLCGGFTYKTEALSFTGANNRVAFDWQHEGVIIDVDGTLTGSTGYSVVPSMGILPPSKCTENSQFSIGLVPGSVCESTVNYHRFSFNNILPKSLEAKDLMVENQYGNVTGPFALKRITHKPGWMVVLVDGETYKFSFINGEHLTNISYTGVFHDFTSGQAIIVQQQAEKPDVFTIDGSTPKTEQSTDLDMSAMENGDWRYNASSGLVSYIVGARQARKKRGAIVYDTDRPYNFQSYRCYYTKCIPPPDPRTILARPNTSMLYSDANTWALMNTTKPVAGDDLTIPRDFWIIADEPIPKLGKVRIEGGLEFDNDQSKSFTLDVDYIYITGRLVIGWEHDPFKGQAEIILNGEHSTPKIEVTDGPELGSKFIGVFGGLDLHGDDVGLQWTNLAATANAGSNQIMVKDAVNWTVNDEIIITTTSRDPKHSEIFKINAISGDKQTLTLNSTLTYRHVYFKDTLSTGKEYTLAAAVGRLTRNIKIKGNEYPNLISESFGARILVGRTADAAQSYVGFARISNVEFVHSGQEGWTESYDPRFSLSYIDVPLTETLPSFVKKNSFHHGFSPAIGVFGVNNLLIEDNVIHHTVESAIVTTSTQTKLIRNLMVTNLWSGSYNGRSEPFNIKYQGSVEAIEAKDLIMKHNFVAGSERLAYHVAGQPCTGSAVEDWDGNLANTALIGVGMFPKENAADATCVKYTNFVLWKNGDFGVYHNNPSSARVIGLLAAENQVSVFPMVVGPAALSHATSNKSFDILDSVIVGQTSSFDCTEDKLDTQATYIQLSIKGRSWGNRTGVVGVSFPSFTSGPNNAPEKPFAGVMSYQAISGAMRISNISFAHFGTKCGDYSFAITSNPKNDDGQHPIEATDIKFSSVGVDNKIFYHVPNVGKINPSDCVDMDCDGLKKVLLKDLDGSFLGSVGDVIPLAEFEWDGDPRRGLGDYRIPKVMLTALNGDKLSVSSVAPNKGLFRNNDCTYRDNWRAYECHNVEYEMLVIESMDPDTETRRLSPVAVLCEGYVDLLNGPQDHGWCSGYTCRKRLSTFQSLVAIGKNHDIYFTSTTPQHLKFHLLNTDSTQAVRLSVWYTTPNRLDVFVGGQHIMPKNGQMKNGKFTLKHAETSVQYMPDVNETNGANYVSREENTIFFVVRGNEPVEIKMASVIIVSFRLPAMTVDDFFGENLISNLAAFLNVDPRKVRIANVVSESSSGKRKKRSVQTTTIVVEIGDEPGDSSPMTYTQLQSTTSQITNQAQLGSFDDIINATVLGISTIEPTPPPSDPTWSQTANENQLKTLTAPSTLEFYETPVAGKEHNVFSTPVRIRVKDTNGNYMTVLGASSSPWQITATLRNGTDPRATLLGTKVVTFSDGWANFTDLAITHMGTGYVIEFQVTSPSQASNFSISADALTVTARSVTAHLVSISTSLLENELIELVLDLRDADTGAVISDITWRNHTWNVVASLHQPSMYYGTLVGATNLTFDSSTGRVNFNTFNLTSIGTYFIDFHVQTDPVGYDFHFVQTVTITSAAKNNLMIERSNIVEVKLDAVYNISTAKYLGAMVMNHYTYLFKDSALKFSSYTVRPGSVIVSMTVEGRVADVNSTVYTLCSAVENATSFTYGNASFQLMPYMTMDGEVFYGVNCGPVTPKKDKDGLHPGIIAALVILSLIIVAIVVSFVVWKCLVYPKTKTHDAARINKYTNSLTSSPESAFFSENSFTGLWKKSEMETPVPPVDTLYALPIDRHSSRLKFKK